MLLLFQIRIRSSPTPSRSAHCTRPGALRGYARRGGVPRVQQHANVAEVAQVSRQNSLEARTGPTNQLLPTHPRLSKCTRCCPASMSNSETPFLPSPSLPSPSLPFPLSTSTTSPPALSKQCRQWVAWRARFAATSAGLSGNAAHHHSHRRCRRRRTHRRDK